MPDEVEQDLDDRRGDIAAAFKEASGGTGAPQDGQGADLQAAGELGDAQGATGQPRVGDDHSSIEGDRARDKNGRFVKQDAKPAESDKPQPPPPAAKPSPAGQGAAAGATASAAAPAAPPAFKPPQSWKPTVREHWGALPAEVQAEVDRREREIAKALQESAEASKGAGTWQETVRPYEAQIRAAGGNPQQYVGTLLQTAHALSYGHPQQKASIVAGLAMQFGITPQDLDSALVAVMQGRQAPQQQPAQFKDPRVDQLLQTMQQREAAQAEDRASRFAEAPGHEYFEDVSDEMVGLIETWKAQGKDHASDAALERAYRIACQANEEVAKVIAQKEAAKSAATAQAATQRARNAGSSVQSRPATPSPRPAPGDDRRADILESMAQLHGR
jgi:hypothetical protein